MDLRYRALRFAILAAFVTVVWLIVQGLVVIPLKWVHANYSIWHLAAAGGAVIVLAWFADKWLDKVNLRRRQRSEFQEHWPHDHRSPSDDRRPPDRV